MLASAAHSQPPLSESAAVRNAIEHSPKLRAARFEAQAAQAQIDRERPVSRPSLTAKAIGTVQGPQVFFPRAGSTDATVLPDRFGQLEVNLDQPLWRAGIGSARQRYGAQLRANDWETRRAENDLALEVRKAYYGVTTAQSMAEVARGGVDLARKHLQLTRDMLEAGTASERDVKASEADLAEAEQSATKADTGVAIAKANLNRIMGADPGSPVRIEPSTGKPEIPVAADSGIATALSQRPDLKQLEESLKAARAAVGLAASQDKPIVSGRATASTQTPSAFVRSEYFAASLVLTWTPFDTGKTRADVRESKAQVGRLEALIEETKLGIKLEVESSWRNMVEANQRITTSEKQIAAAVAAADISEVRYQARSATQLEVSTANLNVQKARAGRAQALADLHLAHSEYLHAIGEDAGTK
jgi:outer membrane protein TolC